MDLEVHVGIVGTPRHYLLLSEEGAARDLRLDQPWPRSDSSRKSSAILSAA